ncbi:hypothetical protein J1N10_15890 [Carboxylicivirga sp. A043]|uniref:hypothetical protein n=1 Tax=Carboxylicivirga litoralis TaxID=2816963 RepID=UPI0021CB4925|nr:hypothetical protein [Carboxylicivirga sp. A043]MCU4157459.1 hypothetical protein [Carboxylicivirga sp. A043]
MKTIFALLILAIALPSCSHNNDCCSVVDVGITIKYLNETGENLLEVENGINTSEISLFHKVNDEWIEYYEGNLDYPKGLKTEERENIKYLVVFPSTTITVADYSETMIQFSDSDFDIIRTKIDKSNSNIIVTEVWYNDQLKWDAISTERIFEIIK